MTDSILSKKSAAFALDIIRYYQWLTAVKNELFMSKQLLRSGTSIGEIISEAYVMPNNAEFVAKLQYAVKEVAETDYWLYLLRESGYMAPEFESIKPDMDEVNRVLILTLKTAKNKK